MQLLRRIRRRLPRCRTQVIFDARMHLSRRVVRLEQADDAGVGINCCEYIVKDEFFRRFLVRGCAELLDDSGHIGLLEEF